jgi:hypothetical protein
MSVDDHFAKALGDTWKQIQNEGKWTSLTFLPSSHLTRWQSDDFFYARRIFNRKNYFRHFIVSIRIVSRACPDLRVTIVAGIFF